MGKAERGIDADGIAGMDAGPFHQLHDARHEDAASVAHGVHFHFLAPDVFVHQHGLVLIHLYCGLQVIPHGFFLGHDLHGPSAQHEAGTHQDGIADAAGCLDAGCHAGDGLALGLRYLKGQQQLFKGIPVFSPVDGLAVRADNLHSALAQRLRQVDGRLSAQGNDDALRLFQQDDVHHVFRIERLEIELVGTGVVSGDRLRVVVDDDGLEPCLADGLHRVNGGVVEFYTLTDTDGTGAENDDLPSVRHHRFVLFLIG